LQWDVVLARDGAIERGEKEGKESVIDRDES
jgi:hypothetical protein